MNKNKIKLNHLEDMIKVLEEYVNLVGSTLGPNGENVIIQKTPINSFYTKDGVTVLNSFDPVEPFHQTSLTLLREGAKKTVSEVDDGTTTTTILAYNILKEGLKHIKNGVNPHDLKRGMYKAAKALLESVEDNVVKVKHTKEDLTRVATISTNNDKEIGSIVGDIFYNIGKRGLITVKEGNDIKDKITFIKDMTFPSKLYSNDLRDIGSTSWYKKSLIAILDIELTAKNFELLLNKVISVANNRPITLIVDKISNEVGTELIKRHLDKSFPTNVNILIAPHTGKRKRDTMVDIAIYTNSTVIGGRSSYKLEDFNSSFFGIATVKTDSKQTTIINVENKDEIKINARIEELKRERDSEEHEFTIATIDERIGRLEGKLAILEVGGFTPSDIRERKDLFDDGIGAVRSAMNNGIVIGGGGAVIKATKNINLTLTDDEQVGMDILLKVVKEPFKVNLKNGGIVEDEAYGMIYNVLNSDTNMGYNLKTGNFEDLMESGIIDPFDVIKATLINSVSVGTGLLSTSGAIINIG